MHENVSYDCELREGMTFFCNLKPHFFDWLMYEWAQDINYAKYSKCSCTT